MGTNRPFEHNENAAQSNSSDKAEAHLALLQDSGMARVERVADKATTQAAGDTKSLTPAEKQFVDAMNAYEKSPDKGKAILQLGPKFDAAIATADKDFETTMKTAPAEAKKLQPAFEAATQKMEAAAAKLMGTFSKVPEKEQDKVESMIGTYQKLGAGDAAVKQAIEQNLAKYPGLIAAVNEETKAAKDPAIAAMAALQAKVETAMKDRVATRMGYADVLKENGMTSKAEDLERDSAEILGIPVPPKPKPKGLLEA
jgi:hypothetical protein